MDTSPKVLFLYRYRCKGCEATFMETQIMPCRICFQVFACPDCLDIHHLAEHDKRMAQLLK
jgi:hypothetical protein